MTSPVTRPVDACRTGRRTPGCGWRGGRRRRPRRRARWPPRRSSSPRTRRPRSPGCSSSRCSRRASTCSSASPGCRRSGTPRTSASARTRPGWIAAHGTAGRARAAARRRRRRRGGGGRRRLGRGPVGRRVLPHAHAGHRRGHPAARRELGAGHRRVQRHVRHPGHPARRRAADQRGRTCTGTCWCGSWSGCSCCGRCRRRRSARRCAASATTSRGCGRSATSRSGTSSPRSSLAGAVAGLAGGLLAAQQRLVTPADLGFTTSALALLAVVIGGTGTIWGPCLGAALVILVRDSLGPSLGGHGPLVLGLVFIAVVYALPRGVAGLRQLRRRRRPGGTDE